MARTWSRAMTATMTATMTVGDSATSAVIATPTTAARRATPCRTASVSRTAATETTRSHVKFERPPPLAAFFISACTRRFRLRCVVWPHAANRLSFNLTAFRHLQAALAPYFQATRLRCDNKNGTDGYGYGGPVGAARHGDHDHRADLD